MDNNKEGSYVLLFRVHLTFPGGSLPLPSPLFPPPLPSMFLTIFNYLSSSCFLLSEEPKSSNPELCKVKIKVYTYSKLLVHHPCSQNVCSVNTIEENSNYRIYLQNQLILNSSWLFLSKKVNDTRISISLLTPGSNNNLPGCLSQLAITKQEQGYLKAVP